MMAFDKLKNNGPNWIVDNVPYIYEFEATTF